jgi:hypothetical protein
MKKGISPFSTNLPMSNTTFAFSNLTGTSIVSFWSVCAGALPGQAAAKPMRRQAAHRTIGLLFQNMEDLLSVVFSYVLDRR